MSAGRPEITIDLVLERRTTKDVLKAVLHSVLFHRSFGVVKPRIIEVLDVSMPAVDDPEIARLVDEKVDAFWRGVEGGLNKSGQILVTFSEKRPRKSWFPGIMGEEEVPWELWVINAEMRQPTTSKERDRFNADLASTLTKSLQAMLTHTTSERGRSAVPLISNSDGISPFPVKITVKVGNVEVG